MRTKKKQFPELKCNQRERRANKSHRLGLIHNQKYDVRKYKYFIFINVDDNKARKRDSRRGTMREMQRETGKREQS